MQHRRGGDVGIGVEADLLARHGRLDFRQGLGGAAEIGNAGRLVVRDHHRHLRRPPGGEAFVEAIEHMLGLVAHVGRIKRSRRAQ